MLLLLVSVFSLELGPCNTLLLLKEMSRVECEEHCFCKPTRKCHDVLAEQERING